MVSQKINYQECCENLELHSSKQTQFHLFFPTSCWWIDMEQKWLRAQKTGAVCDGEEKKEHHAEDENQKGDGRRRREKESAALMFSFDWGLFESNHDKEIFQAQEQDKW